MRVCKKCNIQFTMDHFYVNNKDTGSRKTTCKFCDQEERKARKLKNPDYWREIENNRKKKWGEKYPDRVRNSRLKYEYGITPEQYNDLLSNQHNMCAICHGLETKISKNTGKPKRLAVDHCHSTGKVRGLLCFDCNSSLGKLKDSIENLQRAIKYLEESRK